MRCPITTYSIVARDPDSGQMGVAVQSHYFSVGSLAPSARPGVGAVVIQSFPKLSYGPVVLEFMHGGRHPVKALEMLLGADIQADYRQIAMIDNQGRVAAHTGACCIAEAGHRIGEQYSCQANMMQNDRVWEAMGAAYEASTAGLADRMLAALETAEQAGGDIRGAQSAALIVVGGQDTGNPVEDRIFDLRVEDHPEPLKELRRLLWLNRAYYHNSRGEDYLARKRYKEALVEFDMAESLAPEAQELMFWRAVAMLDAELTEPAKELFSRLFELNPAWAELFKRLPKSQLVPDDPALIQSILALCPKGNGK
jgi:uncharacterized Ntn-hydrolase superfamily protein